MLVNKADIHIHTTFSDGLMTPQAVVEYAATETDLSVIAISDHDTIEGASVAWSYRQRYKADFGHLDIVVASEITSRDGDILGLFLSQDVAPELSALETVEAIHDQGGLAIAVHPCSFLLPGVVKGVKGHIRSVPFDGVETLNGTPTEFFSNTLTRWLNGRWQGLPETGGTDAHFLPTIGQTFTVFSGSTAEDLRHSLETGHVHAGGRVYNIITLARFGVLSLLGLMPVAKPSSARAPVR